MVVMLLLIKTELALKCVTRKKKIKIKINSLPIAVSK